MLEIFIPQMYQKNIFSINYPLLKEKGINILIFDLDNTLSFIDEKTPSNEIRIFINDLSKDFTIVIASNNTYNRVKTFCDNLNCDFIASSLKPLKKVAKIIKKRYSCSLDKVAIIGDQLVTDVFLGNRTGMLTILVDPKGMKDLKITSFNRFIENRIKKGINFQEGVYYEKK